MKEAKKRIKKGKVCDKGLEIRKYIERKRERVKYRERRRERN